MPVQMQDHLDEEGKRTGSGRASMAGGVRVLSMSTVGPYNYTVVSAEKGDTNGAALLDWLASNGYDQPRQENYQAIIQRYVRLQYVFVLLKVRRDHRATSGALPPIELRYRAPLGSLDIVSVPLRLTSIAAHSDMPIYVWVGGKERAVVENFVELSPDLTELSWGKCLPRETYSPLFGGEYRSLGVGPACERAYKQLLR